MSNKCFTPAWNAGYEIEITNPPATSGYLGTIVLSYLPWNAGRLPGYSLFLIWQELHWTITESPTPHFHRLDFGSSSRK